MKLFTRADELHHLDSNVAKEKGNYQLYDAIRSAIEGMVGPMRCGDSDCGRGPDEDDPALRAQQIKDDARRKEIIKQDLVLLKPYVPEINQLATDMRLIPPARKSR